MNDMRAAERPKENSNRELSLYLKEVAKFPLLTVGEEKELGRRALSGDREAVQRMIQSNLRFVIKVAKKYQVSGLPLLDLINEGNLGLIEAAQRFDPERNVRFTSYAVWWIRQSILHFLSQSGQPFRVPPKMANLLYRVSRLVTKKNLGGEPLNRQEMAREVGVNMGELETALAAIAGTLSLDQPVDEDGERVLSDALEQHAIPSPEVSMVAKHVRERLRNAMNLLSKNEREVIRLRFGLDDDNTLTLREIGEKLSLSRERVRQLESQALNKLLACPGVHSLSAYLN